MKFEEAKKKSCACVYKFTFPDGKCYVGKSKNLAKRINLYLMSLRDEQKSTKVVEALRIFGTEGVTVDILSEPKNVSEKDKDLVLSILEIKYIRENDSIYPKGYNVSIGGEVLGIPSEHISINLCQSYYGGGNKPVLVYDLDGNFVQEFDSIEQCAYHLGADSKAVSANLDKRREAFGGKYMLRQKRYGKIPEKILPFKREVIEKKIVNRVYEDRVIYRDRVVAKPYGKILKYNKDGDFCGEYETLTDAALSIGRNHVTKGVLTGGYIFFEHDGGEIKQNIGKIERKAKRLPKYSEALDCISDKSLNVQSGGWSKLINDFRVAQYDLSGNLVEIYDSIKHASYETGVPYSGIWACVFGRIKKSAGFIWRKYEEKV